MPDNDEQQIVSSIPSKAAVIEYYEKLIKTRIDKQRSYPILSARVYESVISDVMQHNNTADLAELTQPIIQWSLSESSKLT